MIITERLINEKGLSQKGKSLVVKGGRVQGRGLMDVGRDI